MGHYHTCVLNPHIMSELARFVPATCRQARGCCPEQQHVLGVPDSRVVPRGLPPLQVLEAFTAWLKLAGGIGLSGDELTTSPLVAAALQGLRTPDAFFQATDAVIELIYCTSERGRPKEDMARLVQMILPEVMALRPR